MMRVLARSGDQFLPTVVLSVEYEDEGLRVVQVGLPGCRQASLPCWQGCARASTGKREKRLEQGRGSVVSMLMSAHVQGGCAFTIACASMHGCACD